MKIFILFILASGLLYSQISSRPVDDQDSPSIEKRLKMREEMHRRMMDKILKGVGPDQNMFQDMEAFMDEVMNDSFNNLSGFSRTTTHNYKMEWKEEASGRTLEITPKSESQKLDISVKDGFITIQGKTEDKTASGISISNFSNSFNVPSDCDPGKVKLDQKEGKIRVHFPYLGLKKVEIAPKPDRVPLPPSQDDIPI